MRDEERIRRSNRILLAIVVLFLLYGIVYRVQTGDNKLYLFGYTIELPFGEHESGNQDSEDVQVSGDTVSAGDAQNAAGDTEGTGDLPEQDAAK